MKKIGIVGGVAWQSTVEYYRLLCARTNAHFAPIEQEGPARTPPMAIESLVMRETRALRGHGDQGWEAYDDVIRQALLRLQASGCDFAIMANNTFHNRLPWIRKGVDIEILSILDAVADTAKAAGAARALVLGTAVTMRSDAYARTLAARGIAANARLDEDVIDRMQHLIDTIFHGPDATRGGREAIMDYCARFAGPGDAVLLACTELPLAFPDHLEDPVFEAGGHTFVNTSAAHVQAALDRALG